MQDIKAFRYTAHIFRLLLSFSLLIAFLQTYFSNDGSVTIFGYKFVQFYEHVEYRVIPLLLVAFFLIPLVKRIFKLSGNYYLSEFFLTLLVLIDGSTHITNLYSSSYDLYFIGTIWFDKVMHFVEGVSLLVIFAPMLEDYFVENKTFKNTFGWTIWILMGFISIFFIAWEIIELFIDKRTGSTLVTSKFDTNEDLAFAYVGFILGYLILRLEKYLSLKK